MILCEIILRKNNTQSAFGESHGAWKYGAPQYFFDIDSATVFEWNNEVDISIRVEEDPAKDEQTKAFFPYKVKTMH